MKSLKLSKRTLSVIAAIVLLLLCYQLAFKKTWEAWQLNKHLNEQREQESYNTPATFLLRQDKALHKILAVFKVDTASYRDQIVNFVANTAEQYKVKVVGVPLESGIRSGKVLLQRIELQGNFKALLTTLNSLEKNGKTGYLRAVVIKKNKTGNMQMPDADQLMVLYVEIVK